MTPLQIYQEQVRLGKLIADDEQLKVMQLLDHIYHQLEKRKSKFRKFLRGKPVKGLYLWGSVGVGKTFLMDLFYQTLTLKKMRFHFHEFMQFVHSELNKLQGHKDPLPLIAKNLAKKTQIICFDEFFVTNIADAMLLGGLFKAIFAEGITLVASSNVAPDDLYKEGIQREQFLPAITQIKLHTQVFHVHSSNDYRLRHLQESGVYFTPLDEKAQQEMQMIFRHFKNDMNMSSAPITLFSRNIRIIKQSGSIIWFNFQDLCNVPRSQKDYLALAQQYRTIMISNLPVIQPQQDSLIANFINLIDVLYDAHIRVVISAEKPIQEIYPQGRMIFEFERTKSRIIEMQSEDYFYPGGDSEKLTQL